ncbi:MAG: glycosyltransferase family 4 protein [Proteobacteria bacterium]|nr:glycosyltransferase family 4 protein [Pseudomonadota bacterium]
MKIALIHYHLKPGGVTTVVRHQADAIQASGSALVLAGQLSDRTFPCDTVCLPGLGYDGEGTPSHSPEKVAQSVIEAISSRWKDGCDLLHIHNPLLAKNRNFLKIIRRLQEKGLKLFLQIHDLAEDGRPLSYFADDYIPDCHYGVINSRDYGILLAAGLKKEGLHKIFNMINHFNFETENGAHEDFVLYPIRAIRRKNIGEAILVSQFFPNRERLVITLPPNSPPDRKSYLDWKDFVEKKKLKVVFDAGLADNFEDLVKSSRFILTTSITEGFGFSFLEPWTARKILWGRKLPDICRDFEQRGLQLDHLYVSLRVPIKWIGKNDFYQRWKSCILQSYSRFHTRPDEKAISTAFSIVTENQTIDFGLLNETFQKGVISRIITNENDRKRVVRLNPFLSEPGRVENEREMIETNRDAVLKHYNMVEYRKSLMNVYSTVVENRVSHRLDKKILLSRFLNPKEFSLLKWCDYDE